MVARQWPTMFHGIDFATNPNASAPPTFTYTDITSRVQTFGGPRGKQNELDEIEAGTWTATVLDKDEAFNPYNTASPYNSGGNLLRLYRAYQCTATWGGTTYPLFTGFVERYPRSWRFGGMYGMAQVEFVDALGLLQLSDLDDWAFNEIMQDSPSAFWPLGDSAGSVAAGDRSGNGQAPLTVTQVGTGGTVTFGAPGMPDEAPGVTLTASGLNNGATLTAALTGSANQVTGFCLGVAGGLQPSTTLLTVASSAGQGSSVPTSATISLNASGYPVLTITGGGYSTVTGTTTVIDGQPHLFAVVASTGLGTSTYSLLVDGIAVGSMTTGTASNWLTATNVTLGGAPGSIASGTFSHLAIWTGGSLHPPGATRAAVHAQPFLYTQQAAAVAAGTQPPSYITAGVETTGARATRILGWVAPWLNSSIDTGTTTVGPPTGLGSGTAFDALKAVTVSEGGDLEVGPDGVLHFHGRNTRFTTTTVTWTLGELELPYEQDFAIDDGPDHLANTVTVTRDGGITVTVTNTASTAVVFDQDLSVTSGASTDTQAIDLANWLAATYGGEAPRISAISINPAANPNLWPFAVSAKRGDRVTVKRRTTTFTQVADYFIERIEPQAAPDAWTVALQLTPAAVYRVLLLDDATYGTTDTVNPLAY